MIIGQTERVFRQGYIWDGMLFADGAIHSTQRVNLKNFSSKNSYGMWIGIFLGYMFSSGQAGCFFAVGWGVFGIQSSVLFFCTYGS